MSWKETFSRADKLFSRGLNAAIQAKEEKILSFRRDTGALSLIHLKFQLFDSYLEKLQRSATFWNTREIQF